MTNQSERVIHKAPGRLAAAAGICLFGGLSWLSPAWAGDLAPEIVSKVWMHGSRPVAAVVMNGDELVRFESSDEDCDTVAEEAEEFAVRLQEILGDRKIDPTRLLPGRDEDQSVIRHDGQKVLSFDLFAGIEEDNRKKRMQAAFDASLKVVNSLRLALGASPLPEGFPDLSDRARLAELQGQTFSGQASWYGGKFNGRRTSDGSRYDEEGMTAAHRSLPFGTKLLVLNRRTGDSCVVHVNDRGPFIDGRIIDLSKGAARQLNMLSSGVAHVDCMVLQ